MQNINNNNTYKINKKENVHKDHRKRVKERFLKYGLDSFSEHQVLEMALFFALPHVDTNEMAHHLINKAGSFSRVFDLPISEIKTITGLKDNAATFIKFLGAFTKYYMSQSALEASSPGMTYDEIGKLMTSLFIGEKDEKIVACFFDEQMRLLNKKTIGLGEFTKVSANYKDLAYDVFAVNAKYVALAHNHPSNSPIPSTDDLSTSILISQMLKQIDAELIENYIIAENRYIGILKLNEKSTQKFSK